MRSAGAGMIAHLGQETTTLAWCWKVTRRDAQVFGFTTHDRDLVLDGVTYAAESGLSASAAQAKAGGSVDNMDISGYLQAGAVSEDDILAGVWDGAAVEVRVVNWADTSQVVYVQRGTLGNLRLEGGQFVAEMRSLSQALQQTVGRTMTRRCDANLGDTRCGVTLSSYTVTGSASAVTDRQTFAATTLPASSGGLLTWTAGENAGLAMEVKIASAGSITLALPMPHDIAVGDTYSVSAGCDKNLGTCRDIFANAVNFRGFPHIPGMHKLLDYPSPK